MPIVIEPIALRNESANQAGYGSDRPFQYQSRAMTGEGKH